MGSDDCYYLSPNGTSVCDSNAIGHHSPLCYCVNNVFENITNTTMNLFDSISFYGIHPCLILDDDISLVTTPSPVLTPAPDFYDESGAWAGTAPLVVLGIMFFIGCMYWKSTVDKQREQEQKEKQTAEAAARAQVQLAETQKNVLPKEETAGMDENLPKYDLAVNALNEQPSAPSEGNLMQGVMSGNEVDDWMRLNCGIDLYNAYNSLFKENGFDSLNAIKIMTDEDLKVIGVEKIGHRRVFNLKIKEM